MRNIRAGLVAVGKRCCLRAWFETGAAVALAAILHPAQELAEVMAQLRTVSRRG